MRGEQVEGADLRASSREITRRTPADQVVRTRDLPVVLDENPRRVTGGALTSTQPAYNLLREKFEADRPCSEGEARVQQIGYCALLPTGVVP